jgi:transcriptional regulator of acetoin/glycerol metabolism
VDIELNARHFDEIARGTDGAQVVLSDDAVDFLLDYDWPGNVRELKQFIECAAALTDGNTITRTVLLRSAALLRSAPRPHSNPRLDAAARHLLRVLDQTRWNAKATAEILAINKTTVYRRLERLGVPLRRPGGIDDPDMSGQGRRPPDTDPSA